MKEKETFNPLEIAALSELCVSYNIDNEIYMLEVKSEGKDQDVISRYTHSTEPLHLDFTVAIICLKGSLRAKLNLMSYELSAGWLLYADKGALGQVDAISPDFSCIIIAFTTRLRMSMSGQAFLFVSQYISRKVLLQIPRQLYGELHALHKIMRTKMADTTLPFRRETVISCIQILIYECYQMAAIGDDAILHPSREQQILEEFTSLVIQHGRKERELNFYANLMCVSTRHLSRQVRQASGRNPSDWIRDYVITEAKVLLRSRRLSVLQVSEELNFPSNSFFGRYFKAATGLTPREYMMK